MFKVFDVTTKSHTNLSTRGIFTNEYNFPARAHAVRDSKRARNTGVLSTHTTWLFKQVFDLKKRRFQTSQNSSEILNHSHTMNTLLSPSNNNDDAFVRLADTDGTFLLFFVSFERSKKRFLLSFL